MSTALPARTHCRNSMTILQVADESSELVPSMLPYLERGMQRLNDEAARILHPLCHGVAVDESGDAQKVLGTLQHANESLDGLVEPADRIWTWHTQDCFKVRQRVARHRYHHMRRAAD